MISIIVPVFNAENRLSGMLDCILAQEYSNYEAILINDGSTDCSSAICEKYAVKDTRIKVISQGRKGAGEARNRGLREASGQYVTFLDADDEIPPNYLLELRRALIQGGTDIAVCDVVVRDGNAEQKRFTLQSDRLSKTEALNYLFARKHINSGPCAKLFRKEIIDGLEFPKIGAYEDIIFVKDAFDKAAYINATDKTEYRYIKNNTGIMSRYILNPSQDIAIATDELITYIDNHPELSPECLYVTMSHLFQNLRKGADIEDNERLLNNSIRKVFKKHWKSVIKCSAFPWKEKALYLLFSIGFSV